MHDRLEDAGGPLGVEPLCHHGDLAGALQGQSHAGTVARLLPFEASLTAGPVRPANRFREAGKE